MMIVLLISKKSCYLHSTLAVMAPSLPSHHQHLLSHACPSQHLQRVISTVVAKN